MCTDNDRNRSLPADPFPYNLGPFIKLSRLFLFFDSRMERIELMCTDNDKKLVLIR